MSFTVRVAILLMAYIIYACAAVFAAVPEAINVEVALKEGGEPLTGTQTVRILIYSSSGADTASWQEVVSGVNFLDGNGTVVVGGLDINPFPDNLFDSTTLEMGIRVNQKEVRVPIVAVPYALRSGVSNTARRYEDPTVLYFDEENERVGVGTQTPIVRLDVNGGVKLDAIDAGADEVAGAIQWTGADFEVFDGTVWKSLTYVDDVDDESKWRLGGPGEIYADISSDDHVGFGESSPVYQMDVDGTALFSGDLKVGGSITIDDNLVVNGSHGLSSTGGLTGSALRLATGNSWVDGEFRFSGVLTGDGSNITNIGESAILDFAMNTLKFVDNAVTTVKMATNAVSLDNVAPGVIALSKFSTGAINNADISNGVISSAQILDGSIYPHMIEVGSISSGNIPDGWVTREKVATGAITDAKLADLSITTVRLSDGAVSGDHFESAVLAEEHFADDSVRLGSIALEEIDESLLGFVLSVSQGGTGRSSWDTGAIPYLNGSADGFLSDTHLVVSNDNLGIGTQTPTYSIHVQKSAIANVRTQVLNGDALVAELSRTSFNWNMAMDGAGGLEWTLNSALNPNMVLTNDGFLGIGEPAPTERLEVDGAVVLGNETNPSEGELYFSGSLLYGQTSLTDPVPLITLFGGVSQAQNNTVDLTPATSGTVIGGGEDHTLHGLSNIILGGEDSAATGNFASIFGGENNAINADYSLILGGDSNAVTGDYSAALGGAGNTISGDYSLVGGGESNRTSGDYAVVSGGKLNAADADYSMVGGGTGNVVAGDWSVIVGGNENTIVSGDEQRVKGGDDVFMARLDLDTGIYATVLGGQRNRLSGAYSLISAGRENSLKGRFSVLGAGESQTLSGDFSAIGAGHSNALNGDFSFIGSGHANRVSGVFSQVLSGVENRVSGEHSVVSAGAGNVLNGDYSVVAGDMHRVKGSFNSVYAGQRNTVSGSHHQVNASVYSDVSGIYGTALSVSNASQSGAYNTQLAQQDSRVNGYFNTLVAGQGHAIDGVGNTQFGGDSHQLNGQYTAIVGGQSNQTAGQFSTVVGGQNNRAIGDYSVALGGSGNLAKGTGSVAMGQGAKAVHDGSFVWADSSSDESVESMGPGSFTVRATGGVRVLNQQGELMAVLDSGSGSWAHVSDRNRKTDIVTINPRNVLDRLMALPVQYWHYKDDPNKTLHLGPMAQDFYAQFKLGNDKTRINQVDADGVALTALAGLAEVMNEKEKELARLYADIADYNKEITQLEAQMAYADKMMAQLEHRAKRVGEVKRQIAVDHYEMGRILADLNNGTYKEGAQ